MLLPKKIRNLFVGSFLFAFLPVVIIINVINWLLSGLTSKSSECCSACGDAFEDGCNDICDCCFNCSMTFGRICPRCIVGHFEFSAKRELSIIKWYIVKSKEYFT